MKLPWLLPALSLLALAAADTLSDALAGVSFAHALPGTSKNGDTYLDLAVPCYYLEVENVTRFASSWGGACAVRSLWSGPPPPAGCSSQSPPHAGYDRLGSDMASFESPSAAACASSCCDTDSCVAWTHVNAITQTAGSCAAGKGCCWVKSSAPAEAPSNYPGGISSGTVVRPPAPPVAVPPTGVRNAVPLGGLGAGTLELRGDGTFHELTFHSASPAGSAKYATQGDMLLGVRAGAGAGAVARALRTAPPPYAAPGVQAITYTGSYPVSKLAVADAALAGAGLAAVELFAYHHLVPGDSPASAAPAVTFTLVATNGGTTPLPVSLFFMLPMGAMADCVRVGAPGAPPAPAPSAPACMRACAANATCDAWTWAAATGLCSQLPRAGGMVYGAGSWCGVKGGGWSTGGVDGGTLSLDMNASSASAGSAAVGGVSLRAVGGSEAASGSDFSLGVGDDAGALFAAFAAGGAFPPGAAGGVTGGAFAGVAAASGAAIVTALIPPGATVSQSVVFTWYFPDRDFYGENIGQFYSNLFGSSEGVAAAFGGDRLVEAARDAAAHTGVWAGAATSGPSWLNDHMANQFSHFRNFIYSRAGEMREHEANDCPDLDSVHNDYQRHLPYLWAVPEFEAQKSVLYESCQQADGHITENPPFHVGGHCGGRVMGDTTTIWILEVLEIYQSTGNFTRLKEVWPAVVRGLNWQIEVSKAQGIPAHLVCTYDILAMERYNSTTFNGVLHIAALAAGQVLAAAVGDAATAAAAAAARAFAVSAMTSPLMWNSTLGFFRAFTGGNAIMSDCLYGQQVALAHGLGWLLPKPLIAQHLAAEAKWNANAFGLTVMKGRNEPLVSDDGSGGAPAARGAVDAIATRKAARAADVRATMQRMRGRNDGQDDSIWMGSGPTWSSLALALGAEGPAGTNVTAALEPTRWILSNYRDRLKSMWDLTGLSTTDDWEEMGGGQPFCTSHYGFMLTDFYLPYALSGQQTNIPAGKLTFAPLYAPPYNVPWAFMGTEGTLSAAADGTRTFAVAFGRVSLPAGGLSVSGSAYPNPVELEGGEHVTW